MTPTREVEALCESMREDLRTAVDELQVAAHLEARGVTDDLAQAAYGHPDIFSLAAQMHQLYPPDSRKAAAVPTSPVWDDQGRSRLAHGPMYLLCALAIPAMLALLPTGSVVLVLIAGGAIGWICAGMVSWRAYLARGAADEGEAARLISHSILLASAAALLAGLVIGLAAGYPLQAGIFMATIAWYQFGVMQLVFLHRRAWVALCTLPAAALGVAFMLGTIGPWPVMIAFGAGILAMHVLGWLSCRRIIADQPPLRPRPFNRALALRVLGYYAAGAAFLLLAQSQFIGGTFDVAIGLFGLLVTAGMVEWRAVRLGQGHRVLMSQVTSPGQFRLAQDGLLVREIGLVIAVAGIASLILGGLFALAGQLTTTGVLVMVGSSILAGGYLLTFVLANMGAYRQINLAFAACVVIQLLALAGQAPGAALGLVVSSTLLLAVLTRVIRTQPIRAFR